MPRPALPREDRTCLVDGVVFTTRTDSAQLCCSRSCARKRDNALRPKAKPRICPCGEEVPPAPYHQSKYAHNRSYCSPECRQRYGKKRQADPDKQVTFNCGTCDTEITRPRSYGATISGQRFCNRYCAARHTKTVKHYVARDMDMVLDSGWEMLFAGLCYWHKVEVSRVDRSLAVSVGGQAYAPDFLVGDVWVEVKGYDSGAQHAGWDVWRGQVGPLLVVDQALINSLLGMSRGQFVATITGPSSVSGSDQ